MDSSGVFRTSGSGAVMISTSCLRIAASVSLAQQFHQLSQNFLAILAFERESELGIEEAKLDADVVAASGELKGKITLTFRQLDQRGRQRRCQRRAHCAHHV